VDSAIIAELMKYDDLALECDGMTNVHSYTLTEHGIKHAVVGGHVEVDGVVAIHPHYWIRVDDLTIDLRARMWAGDHEHVPHGAFLQKDYPRVKYIGERIWHKMQVPKILFEILVSSTKKHVDEMRKALGGKA
jgi:hypothetical protein